MYTHKTKLRVRYGETDQMKYVYYGIYAQYFEVGRVELLRNLGLSYKKLEEMGYKLPVVNFNINYKQPAFYDDELTIETSVIKIPSVKIVFKYKTYNSSDELLNTAETTLVLLIQKLEKPCKAPEFLINKFKIV